MFLLPLQHWLSAVCIIWQIPSGRLCGAGISGKNKAYTLHIRLINKLYFPSESGKELDEGQNHRDNENDQQHPD